MKALISIILAITLTGCVTASYQNRETGEKFKLTTMMKKAEGVQAEKEGFTLSLNKTDSQVAEMLELVRALQLIAPVPVK